MPPRHYRHRRTRLPRPIQAAPQDRAYEQAGKLRDRYEIYAQNARALGWRVKSFDEWLNS